MKFDEVIPQQDQNLITEFIETYGSAYNTCRTLKAPLSYIMRNWEWAKNQYLFKMFGNEVVLSQDYEYGISYDELKSLMYKGLSQRYTTFRRNWTDILERELVIMRNDSYYQLLNLTSSLNSLAKNQTGFSLKVPLPDGKIYKIEENTKTAKCIQKIATAFNIPGYEDFILQHSKILNTPRRKAKLCLSIHPLDYLTMSENTSWSSCMKWSESDGGDYRQGTVEMMNSSCVVCAYLYWDEFSPVNSSYPDFQWNNKRWRKLFIVDKDFIIGIRGYPYELEEVDVDIIHWLQDLAEKNLGWSYNSTIINGSGEDGQYLIFDDHAGRQWEIETETYMMYNDFYYDHKLIISDSFSSEENYGYTLNYSGDSQCMLCGDYMDYEGEDGGPHHVICSKCDPVVRCCYCHEQYPIEQMKELDGKLYCQDCYDYHIFTDYYNNQQHEDNDMILINLYRIKENKEVEIYCPDKESAIWILPEDIEKLREEFPSLQSLILDSYFQELVYGIDYNALDEEFLLKNYYFKKSSIPKRLWRNGWLEGEEPQGYSFRLPF